MVVKGVRIKWGVQGRPWDSRRCGIVGTHVSRRKMEWLEVKGVRTEWGCPQRIITEGTPKLGVLALHL